MLIPSIKWLHFTNRTPSMVKPAVSPCGAAFTPFQYKQHIQKLKSAIEPNAIPNIPSLEAGSEFPKISWDKIFPKDYSQLTQRTFSTAWGLNSTALKPYSRSQKLPPQDLGMIISAILFLRYNIHRRASHILTPALNLLIKSSISCSGGHSTPAFHIPQDLSTIFGHLQLDLLIENYICCPQCFFLNGLTESVTTDEPYCHLNPKPKTQPISNKHFLYQQLEIWLSRFLQWAGIMEILHQHQQSQKPEGSPKCDIWDG
ncbi:hypothetical protein O181_004937 [Austropuccinia psidii MF-1]|uniref:Uncharacterized protein n=1 Tax=Austropuccinia psidii MF-1 TaxID=1389203 RepID=A0A9Q3GG94_9BASI|nr:hypothetical protein [Austropuccinia psidii MF-1]